MRNFFNAVTVLIIFGTGISLFFSCEDDNTLIGQEILGVGSSANIDTIDLIAYNSNSDSIRSDENVLQNAILGAYSDSFFGDVKASFITQVRLPVLSPSFGENATVDSVIMRIPIFFDQDSDVNPEQVDTTFIFQAPEDSTDSDTLLIESRYIVDSIYGNSDVNLTLNVREVNEFLFSVDSIYYSNPALRPQDNIDVLPTVLGSATIGNRVETTTLKLDNSATNLFTEIPAYKIYLDTDFFQERIINMEGSSTLADQASFIRNGIKGFELSVAEDNGFLFNFNPSSITTTIFYSFDNPCDSNQDGKQDCGTEFEDGCSFAGSDSCDPDTDVDSRISTSYVLNTNSIWAGGQNVQINQFENTRTGTTFENALNSTNPTLGDRRLFLNGLDGTQAVLELDQTQLQAFKELANQNSLGILSAQLKLFVDDAFDFPYPEFIYAWHEYENDEGETVNTLFDDLVVFPNIYPFNVQFNRRYDFAGNPNYYQINITEHIKDIVEQDSMFTNSRIKVSMGNFLLSNITSPGGNIISSNPFISNRAYNPYRMVFHGNNTEDENKKLQLEIYYTEENN